MAKRHPSSKQANESIYIDILNKIITAQLPPGTRLIEMELAKAYKVSRTPIRETILMLEKDGLIEHITNRGATVLQFSAHEAEQLYDIRVVLECLAIRGAVKNLKLDDLLDLERRLERLQNIERGAEWMKEHVEVDFRLHALIKSNSGNPRLASYLDNLQLLIHSLRLIGYNEDALAQQAGEQHLALVRALLRRDVENAERLLADHIESSKRNTISAFYRYRARQAEQEVAAS